MAAIISWLGVQASKPIVRSVTQTGTKIVREMVLEGASDVMTSKIKEHTGVSVKTPPPSTPTAAAGVLAYNAGKMYVAENHTYLMAKWQQMMNGEDRTRPEMNQFISSQERFVHKK